MKSIHIPKLLCTLLAAIPGVLYANQFPDPQFSRAAATWELPDSAIIEQDGVPILKTWRSDPERYFPTAACVFRLEPGLYRISCEVKGEALAGGEATIAAELSGAGRFIDGGAYPAGVSGTTEWRMVADQLVVPEECDTVTFRFYLRQGCTGTACFRNPRIERSEEVHLALLRPVMPGALTAGDRRFVFRVVGAADSARLRWHGAGNETEEFTLPVRDGRLVFDRALTPGEHELNVTLLPAERSFDYRFQAKAEAAISASGVRVDDRGRTWVNGEKFFPLGLFDHSSDPRSGAGYPDFPRLVELLAASPFNCLMPYEIAPHLERGFGMRGTGWEGLDAIERALDAFAARDLKVIFSLKDFRGEQAQWWGVRGEEAILTEAVNRFKDHPALLAWYMVDEDPPKLRERNLRRRALVNALDPAHPTWAVFADFSANTDFYAGIADVYGVDPYPIGRSAAHSQEEVVRAYDAADRAFGHEDGLSLWGVPQIFAWGVYRAEPDLIKEPYPSEGEMRAMTLLHLIRGAKGLVMYSFLDLFTGPDPNQFERRWPEVCRVAELARELSGYVLGDEAGPELTWLEPDEKIYGRAFRADDGSVAVLLSAVGPEAGRARFRLDGERRFRSVYGNTKQLPDGSWQFSAAGIDSDVLREIGDAEQESE